MSPLCMFAKFQLNSKDVIHFLWPNLKIVQNEEEILHILEIWSDFLQIWYIDLPVNILTVACWLFGSDSHDTLPCVLI